jgi:hypothetical protein
MSNDIALDETEIREEQHFMTTMTVSGDSAVGTKPPAFDPLAGSGPSPGLAPGPAPGPTTAPPFQLIPQQHTGPVAAEVNLVPPVQATSPALAPMHTPDHAFKPIDWSLALEQCGGDEEVRLWLGVSCLGVFTVGFLWARPFAMRVPRY